MLVPPHRRAPIFGRLPEAAVAKVTLTTSSLVPGLVLPIGFLESDAMSVTPVFAAMFNSTAMAFPGKAVIVAPMLAKEHKKNENSLASKSDEQLSSRCREPNLG